MMSKPAQDGRRLDSPAAACASELPPPKVVLALGSALIGVLNLTQPRITIGRRETCDIKIDHVAISGIHAVIFVENHAYVIEDLESTNGTLVNDAPVTRHVLHHLDVIEIGMHKLHYFDEASTMNALAGVETTVIDCFEPLPELIRAAANEPGEDFLDDTQGLVRVVPAERAKETIEPVNAPVAIAALPPKSAASAYVLRYISGPRSGEVVELEKNSVTLGDPGMQTAVVMWRASGYFLTHLIGKTMPKVNGHEVGPGSHRLSDYDFINIGGTVIEFVPKVQR